MFPEDTFAICDPRRDEDCRKNGDKEVHPKINGNRRNSCAIVTNTCHTCNGYYGPCFDDPVCSTCHAFLYPNTAPIMDRPSTFQRSSDSDSGNDEPVDNSQESMPNVPLYEDFVGKMAPVRVDTLTKEIQRLSNVTHHVTDLNLELFPPEVLMHMFKYLDEISLWSIGQVCSRWREILFMCVKLERWRDFVRLRWPLLPLYDYEQDWYELYTAMMLSSCCFKCIKQMAAQKLPSHWEDSSWRRHRLRTELKAMRSDPLSGIDAFPLDAHCCHWQATIEGPAGSPYEGGLFFLYIQVPTTYPLDPPLVRFITKIFHPNVSRHGDIGIDSIHHNWSLALTLSKLLISIQSLLTDPFCDVCMEPEIGNMFLKNREAFELEAKMWTCKHAMHDMLPH
ncbi:uncharacterized protein morgue [Tribolium castaneum]|uniref:E2 ubiquitin-conjugating enzyme n=1 Tax=Tribolium castaneum TaxID=7070 RepID=D6W7N1_TRICA|nr:PREDICTED: uncharacterized protein LOC660906 [Tribolium castaneum]EFA11317.1 hypothetical protein TcasGA2_TC010856 [Tribolium castaneum]|eukprot:XP_008199407.1 PREDICTED: uncharacterized protein LOC660906 [Tribolium castaneum]